MRQPKEARLEAVRQAQQLEADGGVLLVGVRKDELWQLDAVQHIPQRLVAREQLAVRQPVVHLRTPRQGLL